MGDFVLFLRFGVHLGRKNCKEGQSTEIGCIRSTKNIFFFNASWWVAAFNLRKSRTIDALMGNPDQRLYLPSIARLSMDMGFDWRKRKFYSTPSHKLKSFCLWDSTYSMCSDSVELCMEVACVIRGRVICSIRVPTIYFN